MSLLNFIPNRIWFRNRNRNNAYLEDLNPVIAKVNEHDLAIAALAPKETEIVFMLTQSGSTQPSLAIISNTTGATLTTGYTNEGIYAIAANSAIFTENKTRVETPSPTAATHVFLTEWTNTSRVTVKTYQAGVLKNGSLLKSIFKITIYQ